VWAQVRISKALLHSARARAVAGGGVLVLMLAAAGCGTSGTSSREVVVRVGDTAIDRAEVDHWADAINRGSSVASTLGKTSGTPRERALEFLISASWIAGETQAQGLSISNAAVERGLQQKINQAPNGRPEFLEELASTGQTLADVKLEVKSTLAVAALRDAVAKRVPALTRAEVSGYYAHHRRSSYLPDRRVAYLIEGIHDYAHALALARQVKPGAHLTLPWFREVVSRAPEVEDRGTLAHMVFAAIPGRVAGPALFFGHWVLAVVRKLIPAGIQPLSAVEGKLAKALEVQRRQQALKRFAAAFARRWTARTLCGPGYVVQRCWQYRGALTQENPLQGS
jgi:SurA N-terminal domain